MLAQELIILLSIKAMENSVAAQLATKESNTHVI